MTQFDPENALPTIAEVLALPAVVAGGPIVRANEADLDRRVRWVHVTELRDIASLLHGGELVLTTGIALPGGAAALDEFIEGLASVGVAGLIVELGRRYRHRLPRALVKAAERTGLVLVELARETPFVEITLAVHTLILGERVDELIASDEAHRAFSELNVQGAGVQQIVDMVASMAGRPVIYEDIEGDRAVCSRTPVSDHEVPDSLAGSTGTWSSVDVGPTLEGDGGRLVMMCDTAPTPREQMLLERGAHAIAVSRLSNRDASSIERQACRSLLTSLSLDSAPPPSFVERCRRLGVPLAGRRLVGVAVRLTDVSLTARQLHDVTDHTVLSLRSISQPALTASIDDQHVAVLLALAPEKDETRVLRRLGEELRAIAQRQRIHMVIGVGNAVDQVESAAVTLREALEVVGVISTPSPTQLYYRPCDLGLRWVVHALRDVPVITNFARNSLAALLADDSGSTAKLMAFLAAYCRTGGNKSAVASQLYLSRAVVYDRVAKLERILGVDLSDHEVLFGLYFALLTHEAQAQPGVISLPQRRSTRPTEGSL